MKNNYIKSFSSYIGEQDLGLGGASDAPKKEKVYSVLFIEDDEKATKKYPDGSTAKDFFSYSLIEPDLIKWADSNIISSKGENIPDVTLKTKRENIAKLVKGDKSETTKDDEKYLVALKTALATGVLGMKGPMKTVTFHHSGEPLIDDVDISFIKIKRK